MAKNSTIFAPKAIGISKSPVCTTSSPDITILTLVDSSTRMRMQLLDKAF